MYMMLLREMRRGKGGVLLFGKIKRGHSYWMEERNGSYEDSAVENTKRVMNISF